VAEPVCLVVDASVAVKWVNPKEPLAREARLLLADFRAGRVKVIVPELWAYEVANALRKAVNRGDLEPPQGRTALESLLALPIEFRPLPPALRVYDRAGQLGTSIYDAIYLVLAEEGGCEFWTADGRLYNACRGKLGWVRWIGDYKSPKGNHSHWYCFIA